MKALRESEDREAVSHTWCVLLLSLLALVIGCIGYFTLPRGLTLFYISAHLGALGLLGLIGWLAGILARSKGRSFWTACMLGSLLPIAAGLAAVGIFVLINGNLYCGGSVSLAVGILIVFIYALIRKKLYLRTGHAG